MLTIVLPTFNEEQNPFYPLILQVLRSFTEVEVIIVDGNSGDQTQHITRQHGFEVHTIANSNRAARLNFGIRLASKPLVLLHHPRTLLTREGIGNLLKNSHLSWGGFKHQFDLRHPLLNFTSWYSNNIRAKYFRIIYLDHCIFAQRHFLQSCQPVPEVDIFEDTELCKRLRHFGTPHLLPHYGTTSAVRFKKRGIYRQAFLNQLLKLGYYFKVNHRRMNSTYEKNLGLNIEYKNR